MVNIISDYIPPFSPLPNIAPFTYKDGETYLSTLDNLRVYINTTLVNFVNTNYQTLTDEITSEINALIATVNTTINNETINITNQLASQNTDIANQLATQNTSVNTSIANLTDYVNSEVSSILTASISTNDIIINTIINDPISATRVSLENLYNKPDMQKGLVIGTSISAGTLTSGTSWVNSLPTIMTRIDSSIPVITLTNQAVTAYNSTQMLAQLVAHVGDSNYGYCFIEVSVNDFNNVVPLSIVKSVANMRKMIAICKTNKIKPVIIGSAHFASTVANSVNRQNAVNNTIKAICQTSGITYIDLASKWGLDETNLIGGLHPNLEGQLVWAAAIAAGIAGNNTEDMFDTFDRPDNTTSLNPSDSGNMWLPTNGSTWGILGNQAYCSVNNGGFSNVALTKTNSNDHMISGMYAGGEIGVRYSVDGLNGYVANFTSGQVYRINAGAFTSVGPTFTPAAQNDLIAVYIKGSIISVEINNVIVVSFTDTTPINTGLYAALFMNLDADRWNEISVIEI